MSGLHLGIVLPQGGTPGGTDDVADAARRAEASGLDGVWTGDHLVAAAPVLDSAMVLATAAAVTERVTVGWSVLLPALRQQAWAAKQIASLQRLSRGRAQLGVGVGGVTSPDEWEAAGVPARGRSARTDMMLAALPDLLAGRPTVLATEPGAPVVTLRPPVPPPPLWIGGTSDAALRRVLDHGAGWLAAMLPPDALARRVSDLTAMARARGRPVPPVGTMVFAAPGPGRDGSAADRVVDALHASYRMDRERARSIAVGGGPGRLADGLGTYRAAGADLLVVVPFGSDTATSCTTLGEARSLLL